MKPAPIMASFSRTRRVCAPRKCPTRQWRSSSRSTGTWSRRTKHVRSGKWDRLVFNTDPLDSQVLGLVGFGKYRPPRCSQDDRMGHGNSRVRPVRVAVGHQGVPGRAGFRLERTVLGGRLSHRHRAAQRRNASHDRRRAVQGDEEISVSRERVPGPGG